MCTLCRTKTWVLESKQVPTKVNKFLLIYMWNFLSNLLLIFICKLHWKRPKLPQSSAPVQTSSIAAPTQMDVSSNLLENVSAELGEHFLYSMSSLGIQSYSHSSIRSSSLHAHFLRMLRVMLGLIRQSDLIKFFPKVIFEIDRFTWYPNPLPSVRWSSRSIARWLASELLFASLGR